MNSKAFKDYESTRIGSVYLSCLLDALEEMNGFNIIDKLALKYPSLDSTALKNSATVSLVQLMDIYLTTHTLTGSVEFSIRTGRNLKVSNHGGLSNLLISAPDLKSAIEYLAPFYQLRAPFLDIGLEERGNRATVNIDFTLMRNTALEEIVSGLLTGVSLNVLEFYGINIDDELHVFINRNAETSISLYRKIFGVTPLQGRQTFSISFPRRYLQSVSPLADRELFELAIKNCEALAIENKAGSTPPFSQNVMQLIADNLERDWSQESLARLMNMSVSTLRRRFNREGVTYKEVVTSAKMQAAKTLLLSGDKQITAISHQLGFSDASNFSSAFKRYTGMSPREFRSKHLGRRKPL